MIIGNGIDIVEVERIRDMVEKHGSGFLTKVFTEGEISYCKGRRRSSEHYAARFAAKEAVLKALGTGLRKGMSWRDIEVRKDPLAKPKIELSGGAADRVAAEGN